MRTRKTIAGLIVAPLLLLVACGDEVEDPDSGGDEATDDPTNSEVSDGGEGAAAEGTLEGVEVTGEVDAKPTLEFAETPFSVDETTVQVVEEGSGDAVEQSDVVDANFTVFNGRTGEELESSYTAGSSTEFDVSEGVLIPGLYSGLLGQQAGGRIAVAVPAADGFGEAGNPQLGIEGTDTLVFVFDITEITEVVPPLEMAEGEPVDPPAEVPVVQTDDAGVPTGFEATEQTPEGPLTELGVTEIVAGEGPTVEAGDTVTVHYLGQVYPDGPVFDQSWERGEPFPVENVGQAQVIQGWNEGLVGTTVGSRVILSIPNELAYGEQAQGDIQAGDDLLFVVDILGVR